MSKLYEVGVESYKLCCIRSIENCVAQLDGEVCIANTEAFLTVCTNKDVLRIALGAWHHLNGENMNICNRSYVQIYCIQAVHLVAIWTINER